MEAETSASDGGGSKMNGLQLLDFEFCFGFGFEGGKHNGLFPFQSHPISKMWIGKLIMRQKFEGFTGAPQNFH